MANVTHISGCFYVPGPVLCPQGCSQWDSVMSQSRCHDPSLPRKQAHSGFRGRRGETVTKAAQPRASELLGPITGRAWMLPSTHKETGEQGDDVLCPDMSLVIGRARRRPDTWPGTSKRSTGSLCARPPARRTVGRDQFSDPTSCFQGQALGRWTRVTSRCPAVASRAGASAESPQRALGSQGPQRRRLENRGDSHSHPLPPAQGSLGRDSPDSRPHGALACKTAAPAPLPPARTGVRGRCPVRRLLEQAFPP